MSGKHVKKGKHRRMSTRRRHKCVVFYHDITREILTPKRDELEPEKYLCVDRSTVLWSVNH